MVSRQWLAALNDRRVPATLARWHGEGERRERAGSITLPWTGVMGGLDGATRSFSWIECDLFSGVGR
jgi:hypothetical protein